MTIWSSTISAELPGRAKRDQLRPISGEIKIAGAGAKKNPVRVSGIDGKAAHRAAVRPNRLPWLLAQKRGRHQQQTDQDANGDTDA